MARRIITDPTPAPPLEGRGVPADILQLKAVAAPLPSRGGAGVGSELLGKKESEEPKPSRFNLYCKWRKLLNHELLAVLDNYALVVAVNSATLQIVNLCVGVLRSSLRSKNASGVIICLN